jgi:flavin reductase (DIM6/NTAB) family NADH-FMN oxidoreductase RutF
LLVVVFTHYIGRDEVYHQSPINSNMDLAGLMLSPEVAAGAFGFAFGLAAGAFVGRNKGRTCSSIFNRPSYTPGQTPKPPSSTFGKCKEVFNPSELKSCYNLMISSVTPRPIALVSSRSMPEDDKSPIVDNVAPYSYFGAVAHDPPMLTIGFCRKGRDKIMKDSLANVLARKEFAVNIISEWYLDAANHACGMFPPEVDEFDVSGLTKVNDCQVVNAPRVGEAAITFECKLEHVYPVKNDQGQPSTEIVLARILRIHVDHDVLVDDFDPKKPTVDTVNKLRPMGRLGGNIYTTLGDTLDLDRPDRAL